MNKYHYNESLYQWERVDRVQEYKGCRIETISTHDDTWKVKHRYYRVTYADGRQSDWVINKRDGNIKAIKEYIDFNEKYRQ